MQYDANGIINPDKMVEMACNLVNPFIADFVLDGQAESQQRVMKDVTDDLAKIHGGVAVPARPNGGDFAMQLIQQYTQQPDIAQELQQNEAFAERLQNYYQQYQFQAQQAQNAVTGRVGAPPAQMGEVSTQGMA